MKKLIEEAIKKFEEDFGSDNDDVSWFPYGGDASDFSITNAAQFLTDWITKSYEAGKNEKGIEIMAAEVSYEESVEKAIQQERSRLLEEIEKLKKNCNPLGGCYEIGNGYYCSKHQLYNQALEDIKNLIIL